MEENDFIDLTDSLNSATLEELKERGLSATLFFNSLSGEEWKIKKLWSRA